jgi:cation diffusion facilitator CzcD-associated flavoprotein CzcO
MFEAIKAGKAGVVTGEIETFTEGGIRLKSGEEISADIIVTATGLRIQLLSDIQVTVDEEQRRLSGALSYRGMMFAEMPNLSYTFGYTNASWTLKADLTAGYLCRMLAHMEARGFQVAIPRRGADVEEVPFLDFTSGYVQRALDVLPKQGSKHPWKVHQNYIKDIRTLRRGPIEDGVMEFRRAGALAGQVPA